MSGMDRLSDADVEWHAAHGAPLSAAMARELLAHRRASQAAPGGCGYPCGYDCNGACFQAASAPADELAEIDAMLKEGQGDDDGPQILPDFEPGWSVAAKVEACLHLLEKRRDLIAAPAPSDGLREAVDAAWNDAIEAAAAVALASHAGEWGSAGAAASRIRALRRAAPTEGEAQSLDDTTRAVLDRAERIVAGQSQQEQRTAEIFLRPTEGEA